MSVEPGDAQFVSKLDEASKKKAKEELHELNDADRALAVQTFRTWVLQQKDWLNTPTDFEFLLRFLRVRKFSQLGARETLENYWTVKTKCPEWFKKMDPTDAKIQKVLKSGFYQCPKRYDTQGRRLISIQLSAMDRLMKDNVTVDQIYIACALFYEWLILDENVQVNGIQLFSDNKDISLNGMLATSSNDRGKKFMDFMKKSLPMRLKHMGVYNEPPFMDVILAIFKPFMAKKMVDRPTIITLKSMDSPQLSKTLQVASKKYLIKREMHFYGSNMTKVYADIEMRMLPREYLPDDKEYDDVQTIDKITDDMVADMMKPEFMDYIRKLNGGEYGVNLDKRVKDKDVPVASFRKLNVD